MNKLILLSMSVVACVLLAEANPQGSRRRGGAITHPLLEESGTALSEQERLSERLSASNRGVDDLRALLQSEQVQQNRLDRNNARNNRRNKGRLFNFGDRIQSESTLNFETIDDEASFSNLDASADVSSANKFALSVLSENSFEESASISKSDGSTSQSGTKLQTQDTVDAETQLKDQEVAQSEFLSDSNLRIAGAARDALNAEEAARTEQESSVSAERQLETNNDFQDFFGRKAGGFGSSSPFGRRGLFSLF